MVARPVSAQHSSESKVSRRRSCRFWILILVIAATAPVACAGDEVVVPESEAPYLYLVLNFRTLWTYGAVDEQHQLALLLTTGPAIGASEYRTAEHFHMRRASDGARFDWRGHPELASRMAPDPPELLNANYHLPETSGLDGLGADSILPGETYTLEIETGGVTLRGEATVPADFTVSVATRDGRRIAEWPRVEGASGYFVGVYPHPSEMQTDTFFVIPEDVPAGESVRVQALDANLFRYITDDRLGRAGIDAGFGVFGAVSSASTTVPDW